MSRVATGLASLVKTKGGTLTIRLNPESLGAVRVQLDMKEGVVSARVEAETDSARALLESGVDRLRAALEARGLRVERVQVEPWRGEQPLGGDNAQGEARDESHRSGPEDRDGSSPERDGDERRRRPEADRVGMDPDAERAERDSHEAEPSASVSDGVRHGSARPLTVRLDFTV
ncbi:MAG: flagellar hook-length control protein FliK [Planctomycetota bacterium]